MGGRWRQRVWQVHAAGDCDWRKHAGLSTRWYVLVWLHCSTVGLLLCTVSLLAVHCELWAVHCELVLHRPLAVLCKLIGLHCMGLLVVLYQPRAGSISLLAGCVSLLAVLFKLVGWLCKLVGWLCKLAGCTV